MEIINEADCVTYSDHCSIQFYLAGPGLVDLFGFIVA